MKKFKRMLAGLACVLAGCLCTPPAFSGKVLVYFFSNGGVFAPSPGRPHTGRPL